MSTEAEPVTAAAVDPAAFREALGHCPTGVAVVTAIDDQDLPVGMVVGTFTSVSMDPPLVAFLPQCSSRSYARLRTSEVFTVNVLAHDQAGVCRAFSRSGAEAFESLDWKPSANGSPQLDGTLTTIDCRVHSIDTKGDHFVVYGEVQSLEVHRRVAPLIFFQGGFGGFQPGSFMVPTDQELVEGVHLAQQIRAELDALADDTGVEVTAFARIGDDVAAVASVAGPGVASNTVLGSRYPLMAPLGELFLAWEPEERIAAWLERTRGLEAAEVEDLRRRLEVAREQGWLCTLPEPAGDPEASAEVALAELLRDYGTSPVTPAQQRVVEAAIRAAVSRYRLTDLTDPAGPVDRAATLLAPVFGPGGEVVVMLKLSQLDAAGQEWSGRQGTQRLAERLVAAAAAGSLILGGDR